MTDVVDQKKRSRMMACIKGTNTKSEILVRRALHARGFRFRLHDRKLPGTPDIVLPRWRVAIQIQGCFWHRHTGCPKTTTPSSNIEFWKTKFEANITRDGVTRRRLHDEGWRLLVIWECCIKQRTLPSMIEEAIAFITTSKTTSIRYREIPSTAQVNSDSILRGTRENR